jgi:diaminopimelate epimerase
MRFVKAHAYGNDFVYVRADEAGGAAAGAFARQLCDRHTGIGADGLILYDPTPAGATMSLFNADGSRSEVSGNGVRGLAALLLREHHAGASALTIQTDAGPKTLTRVGESEGWPVFRAAMGIPAEIRRMAISAAGESLEIVALNMGNPQCVLIGELPGDERFRRLGAALAHHGAFPDGTNVEFVQVESADRVRVLIWERGVGPTSSSGTGSCAALVAAASIGAAGRAADVAAPGGVQRVEWREDGVYLTGWAEIVYVGDWLRVPR